ncbi:putative NAD,FAD-dependent dehydrogenase [Levilactobacillus brevis]|nr:putative NAD,FAD-dependent dehydrogenase [Levilactobacillus brevis]
MKVTVVGCTHAGTFAIKQILAEHPDAEVTVYERNDVISFLSCGIALYLGGKSLTRKASFIQVLKNSKN